MSFIFGGDTGTTQEDLQRQRRLAEALLKRSMRAPRSVGEGLSAIGQALASRSVNRKADRLEKQFQNAEQVEGAQMPRSALMQALGGAGGDGSLGGGAGGDMLAGGGMDAYDQGGPFDTPGYMGAMRREMNLASPNQLDAYSQGRQPAPIHTQTPPTVPMDAYDQGGSGDMGLGGGAGADTLMPQQGTFNDDANYRTADLDAFQMMALDPQYDAPVPNDANTTESRRLQLLRRAMFADAALEDPRLAKAMTRMDNNIAGSMGAVGRMYTGDDYELGRLMAEQFASAILRGDSGAQTPEPEVKRYIRQYFPLTGETDEQIGAKRAMRREEIRAMIQSLPDDARPVAEQIQAEIEELKRQADVPDGSLTGETPAPSADGWTEINGVRIRVKQ